MATVLDLVKHYQHAIEKYPNDEQKILKSLGKLFNLDVTVKHLQDTGVGRTVNALRKEPGEVGQAARALVSKWKLMVTAEESSQEDQNTDTTAYNGHDNGRDSDESANQNTKSAYEHNEKSSSRETSEHKTMNGNHSGNKRKYQSSEEEEPEVKKSKSSSSVKTEGYRNHSVQVKTKPESCSESDQSETEDSESDMSDASEEEEEIKEIKVKQEIKKERSDSYKSTHTSSDSKKESSNSKKAHGSQKHEKAHDRSHSIEKHPTDVASTKERSHSSHKHKSSKEKDRNEKSSKHDHSSSEKDKREKEESKSSSKHKSSSEKSDKHKSSKSESNHEKQKSSSEKHSSKSDKHKSSNHSHKSEKDRHKSSSENEVSDGRHKSKEPSSDSRSSKEKHSSSSKEKSKDKSSSSKEKSDSHKSEKKHSSSDSKKHSDSSKHKSEKSDIGCSESKSKHKSSSSSSHKSKSSKSKDEVPKKKVRTTSSNVDSDEGIGCESGASFAEALGMISPAKPKKKDKAPLKDAFSPNTSNNNDLSPAALLAPTAKLAPLPNIEISALPEISPNYKPRPPPKMLPHFTDEEAFNSVISNKNQRTKVYSGNKVIGKITTLYEMCVQVLQEHIDALEYTGGVPYDILKPVVDKASPQQLFMLEHYNPYLMEDTDHLWQKFCEKHFRNKQRQEMETWREMYMRCQAEQESRLKSLTANIRIAQEAKKAPIKQTKMAYVDTVVKPPRNIARKQALHGTAHAASASPAARVAALSTSANVLRGNARPSPSAPITSAFKPKKAPLMQKALQFMRGRKR